MDDVAGAVTAGLVGAGVKTAGADNTQQAAVGEVTVISSSKSIFTV